MTSNVKVLSPDADLVLYAVILKLLQSGSGELYRGRGIKYGNLIILGHKGLAQGSECSIEIIHESPQDHPDSESEVISYTMRFVNVDSSDESGTVVEDQMVKLFFDRFNEAEELFKQKRYDSLLVEINRNIKRFKNDEDE